MKKFNFYSNYSIVVLLVTLVGFGCQVDIAQDLGQKAEQHPISLENGTLSFSNREVFDDFIEGKSDFTLDILCFV